ncbi:hypothetical protein, partial [Sphingomonas pituitosa]|uniref:hypothetical protein n=1 Tax=Sphingomonas pituitosa TaxID=99597 RepID=UPI001C3F8A6C
MTAHIGHVVGINGALSKNMRRRVMAILRASSMYVVFGQKVNVGAIGVSGAVMRVSPGTSSSAQRFTVARGGYAALAILGGIVLSAGDAFAQNSAGVCVTTNGGSSNVGETVRIDASSPTLGSGACATNNFGSTPGDALASLFAAGSAGTTLIQADGSKGTIAFGLGTGRNVQLSRSNDINTGAIGVAIDGIAGQAISADSRFAVNGGQLFSLSTVASIQNANTDSWISFLSTGQSNLTTNLNVVAASTASLSTAQSNTNLSLNSLSAGASLSSSWISFLSTGQSNLTNNLNIVAASTASLSTAQSNLASNVNIVAASTASLSTAQSNLASNVNIVAASTASLSTAQSNLTSNVNIVAASTATLSAAQSNLTNNLNVVAASTASLSTGFGSLSTVTSSGLASVSTNLNAANSNIATLSAGQTSLSSAAS